MTFLFFINAELTPEQKAALMVWLKVFLLKCTSSSLSFVFLGDADFTVGFCMILLRVYAKQLEGVGHPQHSAMLMLYNLPLMFNKYVQVLRYLGNSKANLVTCPMAIVVFAQWSSHSTLLWALESVATS